MSERLTYTVEEAGSLLGISRGSAYAAAAAGELPTVRLGRRLLVPRAQLLALLKDDDPAGNGAGVTTSAGRGRYEHES